MRHNLIRDTVAEIMKEVCCDVQTSPHLIPVDPGDLTLAHSNKEPSARLDVSGRGIWSPFDRSFADIRITLPNCPANESKSLKIILLQLEKEKKDSYQERVTQVDEGTFTPLVFLISGGMSRECTKFLNRLSKQIANKRKEKYADVICHLRTKIRFALLKAMLVALRGFGRQVKKQWNQVERNLLFNRIPHMHTYKFRPPQSQIHYISTVLQIYSFFVCFFFVLFTAFLLLNMMCVCLLHNASVLSTIFTYIYNIYSYLYLHIPL